MLEFKCTFEAENEIKAFILSRSKQGVCQGDIQLKIIGQEQDGTILYTWVETSILTQDVDVTYFGSYNALTKVNKVIFVHEKLLKVANCTINQEHTFLGFVTVEQAYRSESYGKKQKQDIYKAYVAEIQPQNTVFYLNLERQNYLKLQFLYGQYKGHVTSRESHLLIFLHKESIGLYHLPIARVGNDGVIMSGEPKKEQVFYKKFIWSQFDKINQRLYVVYFRKHGKNSSGHATYKPFLIAYQFDSNTAVQFMVEVLLDFPIPHFKSTSRSHYFDLGPTDVIPDSSINLEVLTQPSGSFCICYQHFVSNGSSRLRKSTSQDSDEGIGLQEVEGAHVQYSVAMVHHGKGQSNLGYVRTTSHRDSDRDRWKMAFVEFYGDVRLYREGDRHRLIGFCDYLLVHLPEYFTHLLNVCVEFEACHHILWHDEEDDARSKVPVPRCHFVRERTPASQVSGAGVFEAGAMKGYKITIDKEALSDMFQSTTSSTVRLAIMHYTAVHARDLAMTKSLFESLVNDICNPEVTGLLQEFVIGSTYTAIKARIERSILRFLPFTLMDVFRGQNHSSENGERLSSISYHTLRGVSLGSHGNRKRSAPERSGNEELWENLERHILSEQVHPSKRFAPKEVRKMMQDASWDFLVVQSPESPQGEHPSFFRRLGSAAKSAAKSAFGGRTTPDLAHSKAGGQRPPSRTEIILGPLPPFLVTTINSVDYESDFSNRTVDCVSSHLKKHLRREASSIINSIALEFTSCQLQQSRLLCFIVWSVGNKHNQNVAEAPLHQPATSEDYELFRFYERCVLAVDELAVPLPSTFLTFFASLGFRCLKFRMFMQYVMRDIIMITPEFVGNLLKELDDNDSKNVDIKLQVLQSLSQKDAVELLRQWDHPQSRAMLAQMYSMVCLTEDMTSGWDQVQFQRSQSQDSATSTNEKDLASDVVFPTLDTLIHQMESIDGGLAHGQSIAGAPFNPEFLRHASLENLLSSDAFKQQ